MSLLGRIGRLARANTRALADKLTSLRDQDRREAEQELDVELNDDPNIDQEDQPSPPRAENQDRDLALCYKRLELPQDADIKTVRRAYRRLMRRYHPDLFIDDPQRRETASTVTRILTDAYDHLVKALDQKNDARP
ncbi:MAG: DnaJ domain-containing protein [Deltaproteobacteria bacterium]|nr:DnaJ domain-containing protein [Deltaproteobacteria bacterium]